MTGPSDDDSTSSGGTEPPDDTDGLAHDDDRPLSIADLLRARRDDELVELLASGRTYSEAGRAVHLTAKTIQRRMAMPVFARRVAERRQAMTAEITGQLTGACTEAVAALRSGLGEQRAADRLRAAQLILSLTTRFRTVVELEIRIAELEERVELLLDSSGPT